ncbi:MAG: class I SAM-dependent methyltransferase [Candidatus Pacearchaeota archaeon]|jgi:ubiquinone/menaquinone biosynthesis C-methylase UbiE|nr:class I SAM-dependent methyltransferase [Candidatus Pacearchaeota archaeon]|tara:strand:+ start:3515 stop:4114 length:600 start_codon:yes stop_codon:yes gene_type:complete
MNQKQVWNNIAEEWYEFKNEPSEFIIDFLKKQKGNVLDLGGGAGRFLINIKGGKMYLTDFSKEMIQLAKRRAKENNITAEFAIASSDKLPFKDNFFDAAICASHLHCIKGDKKREKVVKELFRVLKPNSYAKITVWNKNTKRFKNSPKERYVKWRDKGSRYYYLYEPKEIYKLFESIGFKIKEKFIPDRNIAFIVRKPR